MARDEHLVDEEPDIEEADPDEEELDPDEADLDEEDLNASDLDEDALALEGGDFAGEEGEGFDEEKEGEEEEAAGEGDEALDELEAEELELLDDEASESLLVDEAAELRAIRREELTLNVEAQAVRGDEFVCASCFLVKRVSQLANRRKMLCRDCAA